MPTACINTLEYYSVCVGIKSQAIWKKKKERVAAILHMHTPR